jgi:hypothetical protein
VCTRRLLSCGRGEVIDVVAAGGTAVDPGTDRCGGASSVPEGEFSDAGADRLGEVFADEPFAGVFGVRDAPGLSSRVLSLVTVLQFVENLTDRQAAAMAVRAIDWKYAIGTELTDTGFDDSVLSRFRARLVEHGMGGLRPVPSALQGRRAGGGRG